MNKNILVDVLQPYFINMIQASCVFFVLALISLIPTRLARVFLTSIIVFWLLHTFFTYGNLIFLVFIIIQMFFSFSRFIIRLAGEDIRII